MPGPSRELLLVAGARSGLGLVGWPLVTLSRRSRGGMALGDGCDRCYFDAKTNDNNVSCSWDNAMGYLIDNENIREDLKA